MSVLPACTSVNPFMFGAQGGGEPPYACWESNPGILCNSKKYSELLSQFSSLKNRILNSLCPVSVKHLVRQL